MTVAILGGTGFIGQQTVRRIRARGEDVLVIHRGNNLPDPLPDRVRAQQVDRADVEGLVRAFRDHGVTTAVDIIALTLANTAGVREAVGAIGGRYVMLSGADVYANYGGMIGRDAVEPDLVPLTEDAPLRQSRFPYRGNPRRPAGIDPEILENYDKIVIEEAAFADPRLRTTVLRPGMTFGPGDKQRRFGWALGALQAGGRVAVDERAIGWRSSYGYVIDVADAIALAALAPKAEGRIYNIAQAEARTVGEWLPVLAAAMGRTVEVVSVPPEARGLMADRADAMDLRFPLVVDSTRIRKELGFVETASEREALLATLAAEGIPAA